MAVAARRLAVVLVVAVLATLVVTPDLSASDAPEGSPVGSPIVEHYACLFLDGPPRWFAVDLTVTGSVPSTIVVPAPLVVSGLSVSIPAWVTGGGPGASISDMSYVVRVIVANSGVAITDPGGPVAPDTGFTTAPASTTLDVFAPATRHPTALAVNIGDVSFTVHAWKDGELIERRLTCDIGDADATPVGVAVVEDPVLVGVELVRADLALTASSLPQPAADLVRLASDALGVEHGAGALLRLGANEGAVRQLTASAALLQEAIDLGSDRLVGDRHRLAFIGEEIAARAIAYHRQLWNCQPGSTFCVPFIVAQIGFQEVTIRYASAASDAGQDVLALAAYHDIVAHDF